MQVGAGLEGRRPFLWRAIAAARVLAQIRAAQGSYALSPLFIDTHHIKMKSGWAGLLLLTLGNGAIGAAETGGGWNRAYATTGRTGSR
jgi:hypothetical protein